MNHCVFGVFFFTVFVVFKHGLYLIRMHTSKCVLKYGSGKIVGVVVVVEYMIYSRGSRRLQVIRPLLLAAKKRINRISNRNQSQPVGKWPSRE